jgi:predicted amidohydrolase
MTRTVRIATTSIATLEDTAPPFNLRHPDPQETLRRGLALLDAAGAQGADLVCLPEGFMGAGLPGTRIREIAEPLSGPSMSAIRERAARHAMNVVVGTYALVDGRVQNLAVLIDRKGQITGTYSKKHPTEGEIDAGVMAGSTAAVFDTDIGRIGLAVCFDLNWRDLWAEMKRRGAEIVCWLSAYEGGFPLQAYAWLHQFTVVSSVWPYQARIIERTGRILASTSRWGQLVCLDMAREKHWFHTDGQAPAILAIQGRYGRRVRVETYGEEHMFSLESLDPALPVEEVEQAFGLVSYDDYVERCTKAQEKSRSEASAVRDPALA